MKFRFFVSSILTLTLSLLSLNAQPGIILDSVPPASTGQTVCIPFKAKGFDLIAMNGMISWDTQILDYLYTQNHYLFALAPSNFIYNPQGGNLLFSWIDPTALCVSMDDNEVLCEICFKVIGSGGSNSIIKIDTATTWGCYFDGNLWTYVESPPIYFSVSTATNVSNPSGAKQPALRLNPNPAINDALVTFDSSIGGAATLLVTNMLGQTVFKEKTSLNIGKNQIQIPADALRPAGIYQVVLHTVQGGMSQVLVVH